MDKIIKNSGIIVLGILILIAAVIYKRDRSEDKDGETKARFPFEQIYSTGEDVQSGKVICNVHEAERIADYEELDSYYKKRGYLFSPAEYLLRMKNILSGVFADEVYMIHLNFSLTNNSDMQKHFIPSKLTLTSILKDYQSSDWGYLMAFDGKYMIEDGEESRKVSLAGKRADREYMQTGLYINPGETAVIDFVGEFLSYQGYGSIKNVSYYDYNNRNDSFEDEENCDLYISFFCLGTEINSGGGLRGDKIRLNITGNVSESSMDKYAGTRNIQDLKSRSWTNLEWAEQRKKMSPLESARSETEETGQQYRQKRTHYDYNNSNKETVFEKITELTDFQIIDWGDMPEIYREQGNLQKMAKRYKNIYEYEPEELKILLLDISYSAAVTGDGDYNGGILNSFYDNSYLYTRKNSKKWYSFGTADDWTVTSNSRAPERIGCINMEWLDAGNTMTVQMAYILPPDLYEQQDALYFLGGQAEDDIEESDDTPAVKIALK